MLSLFLTLFCVLLINAQEPLSLSDAIRIGLDRNYGILIENKNIETAGNNNEWGNTGRLPTITLNVASNNSIRNTESDGQFFNGQVFPGSSLKDQRAFAT